MASTVRHSLINNLDLMTNLSIGAFHKIYLIDNNGNQEDIDDRFLKKITFNNFLDTYDDDIEYLIKLHIYQNVQLNGGTYNNNNNVVKPQLPNVFTSDGKADKFHTHQISEVIQLPEQLNARRNKTDFNFRNTTEDLVINGLKFKCSNQEKDLCVVLAEINEKLDKLVDSIYGLDLISDFTSIYDVVNKFLNIANPYNWTSSYFENSNLKNGLVHALISFLSGRISSALSTYADTADSQYFIPSNHRYLRKNKINELVYPVYKANNTSIWGHYPVFNRVAFSSNGIQTFDQTDSISGLVSKYNNLTTSNIGFKYKQAFILDNTSLEFKNGASIQLDTTAGDVFKITSGQYYWKDNVNMNNLSILNGAEKTLMLMDDTNTYFHNRLKDYTSGKKYILEDEVSGGNTTIIKNTNFFEDSQYYSSVNNITKQYNFIEDSRVHYNDYKTTKNSIFYEDYQNYIINNIITKNEFKSIFTGIFYENNDTYINNKNQNFYDYAFYDINNISTKKTYNSTYYENYDNYTDNRKSYMSQIIDNATQLINTKNQTNNQYTEHYILNTNNKNVILNNITDNFSQSLTNKKTITNTYTENMTQNINNKTYNWYILNDNQSIYYAPSNYNIIAYDDTLLWNQINSIVGILNGYNTRIISLETAVTSHNTRLTSLESTVATHNTRITNLEATTASHNTRLNNIEDVQVDHLAQLINHNARITTNTNNIATINTEITNIKARLDALEAPKYNIFDLATVIYPDQLGAGYQRLLKNTNTEIYWKTNSALGSSTGGFITIPNNKIAISAAGLYKFEFTIDIVQYSAIASKDNGSITFDLYEGELYLGNYSYYVQSADYKANTFPIFYYKQSNAISYITVYGSHQMNNTTSLSPNDNILLLQSSSTYLVITKL